MDNETNERFNRIEKRFDKYMTIEEEHFDEFNSLKMEFREFKENFYFIMSARRTLVGRIIMWIIFKGDIDEPNRIGNDRT